MKPQRKMLRESDELKQRIADAVKKMKTSIKNGKSVEVTDEIKKRDRTDKATGKSTKDYEKIKKEGLKRALRKKIMEMKRKKMQEAVDRDELQKRLMAKYGLSEKLVGQKKMEEDFQFATDDDYFVGDYVFKDVYFRGDDKNVRFPAQTIRSDKGDLKFSEAFYNSEDHTITLYDLYLSDYEGNKEDADYIIEDILTDIWDEKGIRMFKKSQRSLKEDEVITEEDENPENNEMDFEDDVETEEDTNNTEESEEMSDDEITDEEPVEDEGESEESDEDSEDEENPEDEEAIFDVEDDAEELNTEDDSDDIDSIIASLLQAESKKAKKDDKKEEKKSSKKDEEIEEKCGSKKKSSKKDEEETLKEDDDVDEKIDSDIKDAQSESDQIQESIERLIRSFGRKYPKVFNESTMNKLSTLFEMYATSKAKVKTAKKSKKIIDNVNAYMESVKKGLKAEAEKKYNDVISENAKLKKVLKRKIEESNESDKISKKNRMLMNVVRKLRKENKEIVAESENVKEAVMKLRKTLKEMKAADERKRMRSVMKENKVAEKAGTKNVQKEVRKPIRRSDNTLTVESIKKAISKRTQSKLTDDEIDEMRNHNTNTINESEEVDMTQFEKHIW